MLGRSRENFVRLAQARTNRVLKDLDLIGNLANRSNYSYTEEDVRKIFKAVQKRVADVEGKFRANVASKRDDEFKL